jgi:hypothetical protein
MSKFKYWLWNWVFEFLTKPVKIEQVIMVNEIGQVKIDGRIISGGELKALQEEAKAFQIFRLKTVLLNTPKSIAETRMFTDSKSWDDMLAGKLMLYVIDVQETIIQKILNAPLNNEAMSMQNPYQR